MVSEGVLQEIAESYHGLLSLYAGLAVMALVLFGRLLRMIPVIGAAHTLNSKIEHQRKEKRSYNEIQARSVRWSALIIIIVFAAILPFCLTSESQSSTRVIRDVVTILMVYDFVYYLTHRFVFHDSAMFGGPLTWMHAVHHRQHNPCRMDASYLHPLETAIGMGLFSGTIVGLSFVFGKFHVVTLVITWIVFSIINQHNHTRWEHNHFPFRYFHYLSTMHHNHHSRFTGGNFATITLLYDWLFGTLDDGSNKLGKGYRREAVRQPSDRSTLKRS